MTTVTTREEMKVQVRRIHWEIRLKDDKKNTHRCKENGVTLSFGAWLCYIYVVKFVFINPVR